MRLGTALGPIGQTEAAALAIEADGDGQQWAYGHAPRFFVVVVVGVVAARIQFCSSFRFSLTNKGVSLDELEVLWKCLGQAAVCLGATDDATASCQSGLPLRLRTWFKLLNLVSFCQFVANSD